MRLGEPGLNASRSLLGFRASFAAIVISRFHRRLWLVRAHIAHIGQVVSKGFDDLLINAVGVSHALSISAAREIRKPHGELTERQHFAHHPERWPPRIRVGLAIVPNKGLMAAVQFAVETCEALLMQVGVSKQGRVLIGVGPVLSAQYVRPARAKRDFYSLDGIHHQQSKFPIKAVQVQNIVKINAASEGVITRCCGGYFLGQPIGAQAVVADVGQCVQRSIAITDRHAATDQQIKLLGERERRLVEFHGVSRP